MRVKKSQDVTFLKNANNTTTSSFLVGIGTPNPNKQPALMMNNTQTSSAFTFMGIQSSKTKDNAANGNNVNHHLALQTGWSNVSSSLNNNNRDRSR